MRGWGDTHLLHKCENKNPHKSQAGTASTYNPSTREQKQGLPRVFRAARRARIRALFNKKSYINKNKWRAMEDKSLASTYTHSCSHTHVHTSEHAYHIHVHRQRKIKDPNHSRDSGISPCQTRVVHRYNTAAIY